MPMKMKVQQIMDATLVISAIIREDRKLPQKGKYRLSRMHPKLTKEFDHFNAERNKAIMAYNYHNMISNPAANGLSDEAREAMISQGHLNKLPPKEIENPEFVVPPEHLDEFMKLWASMAEEEIEVDVEPIPLDQLCFPGDLEDGSITAHEFIVLGDLVKE